MYENTTCERVVFVGTLAQQGKPCYKHKSTNYCVGLDIFAHELPRDGTDSSMTEDCSSIITGRKDT